MSSDLLAANIEALSSVQPALVVPSPTGRLTCAGGAWRLGEPGQDVAIHGRDPGREADRQVSMLLEAYPEATLIVVIGLGLGFVLDALERRGWDGRVLAFEPDGETVPALLSRRDCQTWIRADRLRILIGPDYAGSQACQRLLGDGTAEPALLLNPALARLKPAEVESARHALARLRFDVQANEEARRRHAKHYLLNTLESVRTFNHEGDVSDLTAMAAGLPAIVVGAGPSLDHSIDALRAAQDRALIVCVDTALRPLLAAGVAPHVVVAIDPGEANARHLWDLPPCGSTFLAAEASLPPVALEAFRGRTFLFSISDHQPWPWLAAHGQGRGRVRAWGSVLTSAFDLALQMGGDPIVFAGSDLAFTGDRPYARGVVYEETWRRLYEWGVAYDEQWERQVARWPRVEEPGLDGHLARTAPHLVAFRNWLVEQAGRMPDRTFVNATGAGILHGGAFRQARLDDLVSSWPRAAASLGERLRACHRVKDGHALLTAAGDLADALERDGEAGRGAEVLRTWSQFAGGVSPDAVARALRRGLEPRLEVPRASVRPAEGISTRMTAEDWVTPLSRALPLVWWDIPRVRLEAHAGGVAQFRTRSSIGRLTASVLNMPDGAVAEEGRPLRRAASLDALGAGQYFAWRDEVYVASTDGTDPAQNRRTYSLMMPAFLAFIETLPLHEIEAHRL